MGQQDAKELLRKYREGTCTEEEKALVESWYLEADTGAFDLTDEELASIREKTFRQLLPPPGQKPFIMYSSRYVAASVLVALATYAGYIYFGQQSIVKPSTSPIAKTVAHDAAPGTNKAVLTLADGTTVHLDDIGTGKIAQVTGMTIRKTASGQVVYEAASSTAPDAHTMVASYNSITTPRGGQYQVVLPDGTKVWLNASSSLKYPVRFSNAERRVALTGEGYFEVSAAHTREGSRLPFFVTTPTQTVQVLGTHFNINAYDDEQAVVTTLLEGAVQLAAGTSADREGADKTVLRPGQQAAFQNKTFQVKKVNTATSVAWKNGYFSFEQADVQTVLRQLSRWYDVDIVYNAAGSTETFTGKVYRNMTLSKVLDILTYARINVRIEGRKMIVLP